MNKRMMLLLTLSIVATTLWANQLRGRVVCDGKGVAGVAVTNGRDVVQTDKRGAFELPDVEMLPLVYYSLPSGYESPVERGVPQFYAKKPTKQGEELRFELNKSPLAQENHAFVVWADPQVLDMEEVKLLSEVREDLGRTYEEYAGRVPFHGISCGDNVFDHLHLFAPYKEEVAQLGFPFYQVFGNHDMDFNGRSDYNSDSTYRESFGPSYYSFKRGKIHYVTLKDVFYYGDSYRYFGYIDEQQLRWLERDLEQVEPETTVVVSLHIPTLYGDTPKPPSDISLMRNSVMNKEALYRILKPYNVHLMAGHSHIQWNRILGEQMMEHVHAAASGAWWQGPVGLDGTPKGYTIYEVTGDSISWYFKGLHKDREEQFKLYPVGSDPEQAESFVANVFNYDPQWRIYWYENGEQMGEMEQYWGKDPYAAELYQPGKNKKHGWLSVGMTDHLFRAAPRNPAAKIEVVVIDRFGKSYRKSIEK